MARSYGRTLCAIWNDPDFLDLSVGAQHTYWMLTTQDNVSACGSLPLTLRRWAGYLPDSDRDSFEDWLGELSANRFIFIDEDTEELLIRTFVKHDGGHTNSKRLRAIDSASIGLRSPILRQVLASELEKLGIEPKFDVSADEYPIDTLSMPYVEKWNRRRVVVTKVSTTPQPTTLNPQPTIREPPKKASRIDPDWQPGPHLIEWVRSECPAVDGRAATANFVDYWISKSGKDATKLDWDATYRRWMREEQTRAGTRRPTSGGANLSTADQRLATGADLIAKFAARDQNQIPQIGA